VYIYFSHKRFRVYVIDRKRRRIYTHNATTISDVVVQPMESFDASIDDQTISFDNTYVRLVN